MIWKCFCLFQGSNRDLSKEEAPPQTPTSPGAPGGGASGVPPSASSATVQPPSSSGGQSQGRPPFYRSRTDSLITYTPTTAAEAPGATFYIDRKGELDYVVLLKVKKDFERKQL